MSLGEAGFNSLDGAEAVCVNMERGGDRDRVDRLKDGGHLGDGVIGVWHGPGVTDRGEFLCLI